MLPGSSRIKLLFGWAARLRLSSTRSERIACLPALLIVAAVVCFPVVAAGQRYKSAPVVDRLRLDAIFAQNYARNPTNDPADKQRFDAFFTQYYFPAMTRFGPKELADLGNMRQDLFTRFLWRSQSEQLQRDLTQKAYAAMWTIVKDRAYHPAVQYNAILVIGLLDAQYAIDVGADTRPPKPLPEANKALVTVAEAAADGKPVPPQLVVGALIGLERHAKYHESLSPEAVAAMSATAQKLLELETPLPNVDHDVAAWTKLRAASVLAELGAVGTDNNVHLAFMKLASDNSSTLDDRCLAAALLRKLDYDGVQLDGKTTVEPLVQLAVAVGDSEGKRAKQFQDARMSTGGVSRRGGRGFRSSTNPDELAYDRRPLLSRLIDLRRGLGAVKDAVPADQQQRIETLLTEIRTIVNSANDKDTIDLRLVTEVQDMASQIRAVSQSGAADATDVAPENAL